MRITCAASTRTKTRTSAGRLFSMGKLKGKGKKRPYTHNGALRIHMNPITLTRVCCSVLSDRGLVIMSHQPNCRNLAPTTPTTQESAPSGELHGYFVYQ